MNCFTSAIRVEVELLESHRRADLVLDHPCQAVPVEILQEAGDRQPAVDLELTVSAPSGPFEGLDRDVGPEVGHRPGRELREVLGQQHRHRIRLLPGLSSAGPAAEVAGQS